MVTLRNLQGLPQLGLLAIGYTFPEIAISVNREDFFLLKILTYILAYFLMGFDYFNLEGLVFLLSCIPSGFYNFSTISFMVPSEH